MSDFLTRVASSAETELALAGSAMPCSEWMRLHTRHPRHADRAWTFAGHEWMVPVVDDWHPQQVMEKAGQVSVTESLLRKCLYYLDRHQGHRLIYTMPTLQILRDFVKTRLRGILEGCPRVSNLAELKEAKKQRDSLTAVQVGRSWMMMKATVGDRAGISDPADMVVADEWNKSDLDNVSKFRSRLGHAVNPVMIGFSNPTTPGVGVSEMMEVSDKNEIVIECPYCGEWQEQDWEPEELWTKDWPAFIRRRADLREKRSETDGDEWGYGCRKCQRELVYHASIRWAWRAEYELPRTIDGKRHNWRGRHISRMNGWAWLSAEQIVTDFFAYANIADAYSMVLGRPFSHGSGKMTQQHVRECEIDGIRWQTGGNGTVMGIDQGVGVHYIWVVDPVTSSNGQLAPRAVHVEAWKGDLFDDDGKNGRMSDLMQQYNPVLVVFDAAPNLEAAEKMCKKHMGRVWRAMYPPQDMLTMVEPVTIDRDEPDYVVRISRNSMLSHVSRMVKAGEVQLPPLDDAPGGIGMEVVRHFTKPSLVYDAGDMKRGRWVGGPDHLFHAMGYACAGLIMLGNVMPTSVSEPGLMTL